MAEPKAKSARRLEKAEATSPRALERYEDKRDPGVTNEPFGGDVGDAPAPTIRGSFVVHLHDATRTHYDMRLEVGGTLKSFAVPKGPSLDPESKLLAVNTEDHPIEYLDFEDVIPEGQYGAGPMIVWDRGRVVYLEQDAEKGVAAGKLDFVLRGMKLFGRFALVKLKKGDKEWLLLKKRDAYASKERNVIEELPRSVVCGLTVAEMEQRDAIAAKHENASKKIGEPWKKGTVHWVRPRLSTSTSTPTSTSSPIPHPPTPTKKTRVHAALGGLRAMAVKNPDGVTISMDDGSASGSDVTAFYPELVRSIASLPATALVLDGEIACFDEQGRVRVEDLRARVALLRAGDTLACVREHPAAFVAFDILRAGDFDVTGATLADRVRLLHAIVPELGFVRRAPDLIGDAAPFLAFAREHGLAGAIVRKDDEAYDAHATWTFLPAAQAGSAYAIVDHGEGGPRSVRHARVTNRTKIFFPELGLTKGDLVDYYVHIAPFLLPYLERRPLVVVRYPDGIHGKSFFQWNVPQASPPWLGAVKVVNDEGKEKHAFLVDDVAALTHVANLGAIPFHVLAFKEGSRDTCDFFTLDFDVKESGLARAIPIIQTLHSLLDRAGLPSFPKTSGQTGVHVLVPLGPGVSFDTAKMLAEIFGRMLVGAHGKDATMERVTTRREGKVFVDVGQTGPSRTIVCPYSVRATPEATVSCALDWDEVTEALDPTRYTIKTVPARLAKHGDPMRNLLTEKPDVAAAIERIAKLTS